MTTYMNINIAFSKMSLFCMPIILLPIEFPGYSAPIKLINGNGFKMIISKSMYIPPNFHSVTKRNMSLCCSTGHIPSSSMIPDRIKFSNGVPFTYVYTSMCRIRMLLKFVTNVKMAVKSPRH